MVDVTWTGEDHGAGLARTLSHDPAVKKLSARVGNLEVRSYSEEFQGWTLQVDRRLRPTHQDWKTITTIAEHLLSAPRGL